MVLLYWIGGIATAGAVSGGGGAWLALTETLIESLAGSPPSAISMSCGDILGVVSSTPREMLTFTNISSSF